MTGVALAAGTEFTMRGDDLVVSVDARWAGNSQGGYYPIRIRVVNRGPDRNLTFHYSSPGRSQGVPVVTRTIGVKQNAAPQFTLSVPMVSSGTYGVLSVYEGYRQLESLGTRQIPLPDVERGQFDRPALLVISPNVVDCGRFEDAVNSNPAAVAGGGHGYYGGGGAGSSRTADHEVVPADMLPESWIDYSGLDIVAVSLQALAGMDREYRTPILDWVHQGGTLIVYNVGEPAEQSRELSRVLDLEGHNCISPEWEPAKPGQRRTVNVIQTDAHGNVISLPRGLPASPGGATTVVVESQPVQAKPGTTPGFVWAGASDTFVRRQLMQGYVYAFKVDPFPGSVHDWDWFLQSLGQGRYQWTARHGISARRECGDFLNFLIPGIEGVPVLAFLVLITAFTAVIGPLNYFVLWKRKQLYMLVVSIPVIAFVTSLSLFAYSAVAHGFGTKSRARSLTILDQKSRTAVTTSRIALYAGLAPSRGLRFSRDTAVYTLWPQGQEFESGSADWTETQALETGWLRSRTRTQFMTVTHRAERGRLEVGAADSETIGLSNGLEWDIEALIVADADGTLYFGEDIPAGASTRLREADTAQLQRVTDLVKRHPLAPPPGIEHSSRVNMFGNFHRRHGRWYGDQPVDRFGNGLSERTVSRLAQVAGLTGGALQGKSYLAVLKGCPAVELGVEKTDQRASSHVLVGYY